MASGYCIVISSFILMMGNVVLNPVRGQISWTPIYVDTSNRLDLWTVSSTGCLCSDGKSSNCACCVQPGGCLCSFNPNKCAQCGLEDACQRFCNVTISSRVVANRSKLSWVHLKSPELEGPTSCWWRLQSAPGQRIEVQIHRIVSVGEFVNSSQTCKDGFLQFADGDMSTPSTQAIQLCGQNSRFSPPVVMFGDQGIATLLLSIEGKSSRSQVLAYVSFSSRDDITVGDPSRGGRLRPHSVCDWTYENCWKNECILASPGYPGLFPPHRRCRYFLNANSTTDRIIIKFHSLNIPPPPLCSSHHIAIWRRNVSNLAQLGLTPPWKTLCQHSDPFVEVDGGQALIEFRSGSTTSPNLYNGFRASVEFLHTTPPSTTTMSPPPKPSIIIKQKISQVPAENSQSTFTGGSNDDIKERNTEETLGYARAAPTYLESPELHSISCNHVFDGNSIREKGFRLKIPKDLSGSTPVRGGSSNTGGGGGSLYVNSNSRKASAPFKCRVEFQGKSSDVVQLALSNYKLRGSNCSTQIEVYDVVTDEGNRNRTTFDRLVKRLCGPLSNEVRRFTSLTSNRMAISVVVSPYESPVGSEVIEGAFRFHDESIEGTVKPLSNCEMVYYGLTSSPSGSLAGPSDSPLLRLSPLPLVCSYSFHPAPNQSVLLTLNSTGHDTSTNPIVGPLSKNYCRTLCTTSGCLCVSKSTPLEKVDHLRIVAGSIDLSCFCGSLSDVLPVAFESHTSLALVFHGTTRTKLFGYTASYQFSTATRCNNFSISPPSGWKRWREILTGLTSTNYRGLNTYSKYDCSWAILVPPRYKLSIDLVSEENERDCKTWNLTVWIENNKFPNRSDLLSSMCPEEGRKEVKIPETVRNAFIKLHGVSHRAPQFEIRWRYTDVMVGSNRLPEKMMSDASHKIIIGNPELIFSLINLILYLTKLLI